LQATWQSWRSAQSFHSTIKAFAFRLRTPAVIENEADCGTRFHQADRNRKLVIEHAKIKRKPVLFKTSNTFSKERGLRQVIRL